MRDIKIIYFLIACSFALSNATQAEEKDYTLYHKGVIDAGYAIFIKHDSIKGLQLFKQTFDGYDFVYVDDCIEAFQLALFFRQEDYATQFIKKALDNGFELGFLDSLNMGCPCNFYAYPLKRVTIFHPFIDKHRAALQSYADEHYAKYIQRIDKDLVSSLIKRHVKEQLYKNYHALIGMSAKEQDILYYRITDDNLHFMDSLAKRKIFVGERNLGIYTNKQAANLKLPFVSIENYLAEQLHGYNLPRNTYVPIKRQGDYFEYGCVYNMQYHNTKTYDSLTKYKDEAIRKGYLHPREYASLRFNYRKNRDNEQLYLTAPYAVMKDTKVVDERRAQLVLPSYEIDYAKHEFAHKNNLQLFFGFFNDSR